MTDNNKAQLLRITLTVWATVVLGALLALGGAYLLWLGGSWYYLLAGLGLLGQAQQPVQRLKDLAERQVPIWRTVRKEFLKNLSRAKAVKTGRERTGTELDV